MNSVRIQHSGMDLLLDNQIFKNDKTSLYQPHWPVYIHVGVDFMVIIESQSHCYLAIKHMLTMITTLQFCAIDSPFKDQQNVKCSDHSVIGGCQICKEEGCDYSQIHISMDGIVQIIINMYNTAFDK